MARFHVSFDNDDEKVKWVRSGKLISKQMDRQKQRVFT